MTDQFDRSASSQAAMTPAPVRERPILFSGAMVRALLAGTKTQTRRALKPQPSSIIHRLFVWKDNATPDDELLAMCPYGQPGDRLWVRESMYFADGYWRYSAGGFGDAYDADYVAARCPADEESFVAFIDHKQSIGAEHCPSIHMPRWASRIQLEVTGVRVERLQDISEADAIAEGCKADEEEVWWQGYAEDEATGLIHQQVQAPAPPEWMIEPHRMKRTTWLERPAKKHYELLWGRINGFDGPASWAANPWIWVVEFKRTPPVSQSATPVPAPDTMYDPQALACSTCARPFYACDHNPEKEAMNELKNYRKKNVQPMRPYVPGEDMTGISVNKEDTPELGGMIAVNPKNSEDRWYVAKQFFEDNYEEA